MPVRIAALRRAVAVPHVFLDQFQEVVGQAFTAQGAVLLAVHENGRDGRFTGAGQADPDVGLAAFPGSVYDTTHHGQRKALDAGIP